MSYTTLLGVDEKTGDVEALGDELRNGWGSAPLVWGLVASNYGIENYMFADMFGPNSNEPSVMSSKFLPRCTVPEAWALAMTYDCMLVSREHAAEAAKQLRALFEASPPAPDRANHWPKIIETLENMPEGVAALGINHTSCGATELLGGYDEDTDEHVAYNVNTDTKHFYLTQEMIDGWRKPRSVEQD